MAIAEKSTVFTAPTRRGVIAAVSLAAGGLMAGGRTAAAADAEISHIEEAIHQDVTFKASRARVYAALTDTKQFQRLVVASGAVKSGMVEAAQVAEINPTAGGAFSLFGGHITGRNIELIPNSRIVQAWRAGDWAEGIYSIARFELSDDGTGTKLVFDHTGFPRGKAEHLAAGWKSNYWEPLAQVLAEG